MSVTLESLYEEHAGAVLSYLRRRFGGVETPEDLLQETFVQATLRPDALIAAQSPRAWLLAVARNVAATALRRRRPTAILPASAAAPSDPESESAAELRDGLSRLRCAIAALPAGQRETLELRLCDELSYDEIAVVLRVPVGTVRSRLHAAILALRERLKESQDSTGRMGEGDDA